MAYDKYFLAQTKPAINPEKLDAIIRHALIEDIGRGDITTQLTIPKDKEVKARIIANEDIILCGVGVAEKTFKAVDNSIKFDAKAKEGRRLKAKKTIAQLHGKASSILTAERVGLNLLSLMSGIAGKTREFVERIEPCKTKITDTRKTMPGLRELQKYAVRIGGGHNHRIRLDEMIIIKDNHIKVTDGYSKLPSVPKGYKIEIEVQNLEEFKHALHFKPDVIMLDNMDITDIKEAVKIRNATRFSSHHPPTKLEVSGGIGLDNVREYAETGVEIISIGELTDSVKSADISLDIA